MALGTGAKVGIGATVIALVTAAWIGAGSPQVAEAITVYKTPT